MKEKMHVTEKVSKVVKITAGAAIGTAINGTKAMAIAAPIAIGATTIVNKICLGEFNLKGAAIEVAKDAAITIGCVTTLNAAIAATVATTAAVNNSGIFAIEDEDEDKVDDLDWDEEEA